MASPLHLPVEDKELEDAALWAVIDSAAAASYTSASSKYRKPLSLKYTNFRSPQPNFNACSPPPPPHPKFTKTSRFNSSNDGVNVPKDTGVVHECWNHQRPTKISRSCVSEMSESSPLVVVKHAHHQSPAAPVYTSPDIGNFFVKEMSPSSEATTPRTQYMNNENKDVLRHSLSGRFPTVSLFKEYQNAAMSILEKSDYTVISGSPFIKKSGWRKMAFYFNVSFEIKDKIIEFDENRNVQRAEFVVRAYMQGGRFSDGWGSCERREKRFSKPNHDIPSTAETRAKTKACQDLLGIGQYRSGGSHSHSPR
ncbi:hypothetical protein Nepgr_011985 [Nepenthes gracilis]|uniref:Uncharacterized protein n=1 Tax=Nepenthes gracilis TaxID=150966 RepID=A0AAD3SGB0_NEPGR|nr:hypothetical protein Nepgr_011985 [Nepenthes gracilis]